MALVVHDTLTLTTDNGESKIQLCIGDITKLPKQDEVECESTMFVRGLWMEKRPDYSILID